jgi:hypothetical protein
MDEWKGFYFSINPAARKVDKGDISERQAKLIFYNNLCIK